MKAMILAAGIGTRLQPLTKEIPKALIKINQIPLLEHVIRRLKKYGVSEIIINVHHFADQIIHFVKQNHYFNIRIEFSIEDELLDTGGGLKNAEWFFNDDHPFILHNVDIISGIDLNTMFSAQKRMKALAVLAVRKRDTSRKLLFDENMHLIGWASKKGKASMEQKIPSLPVQQKVEEYAFLGIHAISPQIFALLPKVHRFSIIDAYLQIAANTNRIFGAQMDNGFWLDVGKVESLKIAESFLR